MTPIAIVNTLLHFRKYITILVTGGGALGILLSIVRPPMFVAVAMLTPQQGDATATRLASLAAQFGVAGFESEGQSIDFYAEVLTTPDFLRSLALDTYAYHDTVAGETVSGTLLDLYEVTEDNASDSVFAALDILGERVSVDRNLTSNILTVRVADPNPQLAELISRRLLDLMDRFNTTTRQVQARNERVFIEERLATALEELRHTESELQTFLESNRQWQHASSLQFEHDRIQRRVSTQQQVYTTLAQAFEQARIDEVRNTPVITVISSPEGTARRNGKLIRNTFLGLVLGGLFGIMTVFVKSYAEYAKEYFPEEYSLLVQSLSVAFRKGTKTST